MARKRNRLEIIYDILKVIAGKKMKPTHIMYKSNLSHTLMKEYIEELKQKELIKEELNKKGKTYSITIKGRNYLNEYHRILRFTESFGI